MLVRVFSKFFFAFLLFFGNFVVRHRPDIRLTELQILTQMVMRDILKRMRDTLRPIYGAGEAEAIIRIIFHYLKGWNTVDMVIHEGEPLSPFVISEINKILARLKRHEPIQYITGEARFHGMELHVTPDVLIPRPETDELVDIIADRAGERADLRVLDIGTGSGCIAIALARTLRFPHVSALDISDKALAVARENASRLKAAVTFIHADIFKWDAPRDSYDIIVSNPPYVDESEKAGMDRNVLDHEPASALFVPDSDPLVFYRRIADVAATALAPGGFLYFEINPRHAEEMKALIAGKGFTGIEIIKDSFGKDRFLAARQPGTYE